MANIFGLGIGVFTQGIIPRALGPIAFGDYNFLTSFFSQVIAFLDMGTSEGFYTKLSRRPQEIGLIAFYIRYVFGVGVIMLGGVGLLHLTTAPHYLWPGQVIEFIFLAAVGGLLLWVFQILEKVVDAAGITVWGELVKATQKVLGLGILIYLYRQGSLTLAGFFGYQYFNLAVLILGLGFLLHCHGVPITAWEGLSAEKVREYCREFFEFSHPLATYSLLGLVVGVFDRWLLQVYGGSTEQGFFALSSQIGAICFLLAGSLTSLLTREFSIAHGQSDRERLGKLFRRYIPMMYGITAFFSCFILVQASTITRLFGGAKFAAAVVPVAIMALYPVQQVYGQLSGSLFFATDQTRIYRNIGIFFMLLGIPMTYLAIAPQESWGFQAGAVGLSVKTVLLAFFSINVQLFFNTRYLNLSFTKFLLHQFGSLLLLCGIAKVAAVAAECLSGRLGIWVTFLLAGIFYSLLAMLVLWMFPIVIGLNRDTFASFLLRSKAALLSARDSAFQGKNKDS